ncbi:uncharacterized protein LOC143274614 [Babylonia areolata]|uniref:uncharacterized protein LOC143274614 n=1 Tax=Babylonia areolata TaxID=304850 RepID=UPI003FD367CB
MLLPTRERVIHILDSEASSWPAPRTPPSSTASFVDRGFRAGLLVGHTFSSSLELRKSLEKAAHERRPRQLILCGDFNCPDVNWKNGTTTPEAPQRQVQETLVNVTETVQLTQVHAESTRENDVLGLVFTTNPTLVKNSSSVPGISDHAIVVTDIDSKVC